MTTKLTQAAQCLRDTRDALATSGKYIHDYGCIPSYVIDGIDRALERIGAHPASTRAAEPRKKR